MTDASRERHCWPSPWSGACAVFVRMARFSPCSSYSILTTMHENLLPPMVIYGSSLYPCSYPFHSTVLSVSLYILGAPCACLFTFYKLPCALRAPYQEDMLIITDQYCWTEAMPVKCQFSKVYKKGIPGRHYAWMSPVPPQQHIKFHSPIIWCLPSLTILLRQYHMLEGKCGPEKIIWQHEFVCLPDESEIV